MPVTCPHCSTRYTLPEALLGPGGARVRCPRCREPFAVGPDGATAAAHAGPPVLPSAGSLAAPERIDGAVHSSAAELDPRHAPPFRAVRETAVARAPDADTPAAIARAVLDDLDSHSGEAIAASRAEGRLFRDFGAVIAEAFEFYRRRVGSNADPAPFRAALRDRWGVDLDPGPPPKRLS